MSNTAHHPFYRLILDLKLPGTLGLSEDVEINTVDGYQGREKDVIILTTVRSERSGVGFLSDTRRMNVALTRARTGLYVVGDEKTLLINPHWKGLIRQAKEASSFVSVSTPLTNKVLLKTVSTRKRYSKPEGCEPVTNIKMITTEAPAKPKPPPLRMKDVLKTFSLKKKSPKPQSEGLPVAQLQMIGHAAEAPVQPKPPMPMKHDATEDGEIGEESSDGEEEVLFLGTVLKKPKSEVDDVIVVD